MKPGKYSLKQTKAPLGYVLQVKEYPFEITAEGKVTGDTKIVNVPTVVVIMKLDPDKKPVAEAAYEVCNAENKKVSDGKTDKDGKLTVGKALYNIVFIDEFFREMALVKAVIEFPYVGLTRPIRIHRSASFPKVAVSIPASNSCVSVKLRCLLREKMIAASRLNRGYKDECRECFKSSCVSS